MRRNNGGQWVRLGLAVVVLVGLAGRLSAQTAGGRPDDTPSLRVGATLFADYTYTQEPTATDADGNTIHPAAFNVGRSYVNVTGNVSHVVAYRFTSDIARETGAGSSLNGSLTFRVKYAFAQFNLDDWMARGSWARVGIQETPWVDFQQGIYRYRFQGTVFSEREGFLSSSDAGASFHHNLPAGYGDVHVGVYNGESYGRAEANDQKALQFRGTVRPFAGGSNAVLKGLRAHAFVNCDHYVKNGPRTRLLGSVTFEHPNVNAGFDYLNAADQTSVTKPKVDSHGYSVWATPRSPSGWEMLLRYDHYTPDAAADAQTRSRTIVGVAYWFPHQGTVSSALLLDYDGQRFHRVIPEQPNQRRVAVHALVNF